MNPIRRRRLVGNPYPMVAAQFASAAAQFAAITDAAQVGLNPGTSDFTLAAWVNPDSISALQTIWGKGSTSDTASGAPGYWVFLASGTGRINVEFSDNATSTRLNLPSANISAGQWSHIALVFNRSGSLLHYVNGALQATTAISTRSGSCTPSADFALGCSSSNGGAAAGGSPFNGRIDTPGFWLRALSAAEVSQLFSNNVGLAYRDLSSGLKTNLSAWHDLDGTWRDSTGVNPLTPGAGSQSPTFGPGKR